MGFFSKNRQNNDAELRERCAELRCSNSVRFMAIKCNLMVVRSIKRILGMELVSDDEKIGLMRTLFYSLESDPSVLPTRK